MKITTIGLQQVSCIWTEIFEIINISREPFGCVWNLVSLL